MNTKIGELTKQHNKTQQEMAQLLGISQASYYAYTIGRAEPSLEKLIKLADFFGCSVDYLLGHQTKNVLQLDLLTPAQREVFDVLKTLDDKEAYSVLGYMAHMRGDSLGDLVSKIMNDGQK